MRGCRTLLLALLVAGLALATAPPVVAQAVITNGTISLGINMTGDLNYNGVGIKFLPTGSDGTISGCPCEGWGAAVVGGTYDGTSGYADESTGTAGLNNVTFSSTSSSATSTVTLRSGSTDVLRVTQYYHPSATTPNLYQVDVTLTNLTGGDLGSATNGIRYRRLMDWDIMPTAFSEFVTIQGWPATDLMHTSDNGFASADPLSFGGGLFCGAPEDANFTDSGPCDHGALFDFGFSGLAAGASRDFTIFYGAAGTEAEALAALGAVGAEVYSLGECNPAIDSSCSPTTGTPNTFIFGFQGVGGTPLPPISTVPEPGTLLLLGTGLAGIAARLRRRVRA